METPLACCCYPQRGQQHTHNTIQYLGPCALPPSHVCAQCSGHPPATVPLLAADMPSAARGLHRTPIPSHNLTNACMTVCSHWHLPATAPLLAAEMPRAERGTRRMPSTERTADDTSRVAWKPGRPTNCRTTARQTYVCAYHQWCAANTGRLRIAD